MQLEKLKSVIIKANPEIMGLKMGCELMDKTEPKDWAKFVTLVCYDNHNGRIYLKESDGSVYHERTSKLSNYEIIGRPIRLDDYLEILKKVGYNSTEDWFKVLGWVIDNWKPGYLNDQSEEVINKLYNYVQQKG